ncbi:hypothetical protein DFH09DRAFT_1323329 [Mycena vulgaris]|nr:hypothetical protein DFH09DRAFT_1323329 [Mycena vulgaris]
MIVGFKCGIEHNTRAPVEEWLGRIELTNERCASCLLSLTLAHRRLPRDAIHTIQDALSFIAHPRVVQMGAADTSLRILIAALLPALVLHVKRFY